MRRRGRRRAAPPDAVGDVPPDQQRLEALVDAYLLDRARAARKLAIAAADAGPVHLDLTPTPQNLVRWAWWLGPHWARNPTNRERRKLLRWARDLLAGRRGGPSRRPRRRMQGPEPGSYEFMMDYLALIFESAGRPEVLRRLENAPLGQRLPRLERLRASRIGNGKSLEVRRPKSAGRAARAVRLHIEGLPDRAIAERLGVSEKTVQRALRGKRARRRTGRRESSQADICGPSETARPVYLRSDRV